MKTTKKISLIALMLSLTFIQAQASNVLFSVSAITGADSEILQGTVLDAVADGGPFGGSPRTSAPTFGSVTFTEATAGFGYNSGNVPITVGNLTFQGFHFSGHGTGGFTWAGPNQAFASNPPFSALSQQYKNLLYFGSGITNSTTTATISIAGLTTGDQYEVRFWEQYSSKNTDTVTFSADGVTSDPAAYSQGSASGSLGYYVTATFTADSSTEVFSMATLSGTDSAFLSAVEVLAVPEPSTVALLAAGAGLLGFAAVRRFRLAAV